MTQRQSRAKSAAILLLSLFMATVGLASSPAPVASAAVSDGAIFNDPIDAAGFHRIRDHVRSLINGTPASYDGSTPIIRVAMYHFSEYESGTIDALLAAAARGVKVRVILDSREASRVPRLINGLNSYPNSWAKVCPADRGCIAKVAGEDSKNHNKFFLFWRTNSTTKVVVQTSANFTETNSNAMWNNAVTLVNAGLYDAYVDYFEDLTAMTVNNDYYRTANSGNAKLYMFPRAGSSKASDTIYNTLHENVTCTATGSSTRTTIRIAMFQFTRQAIADELVALAKKGCDIKVILTQSDSGVDTALTSHSRITLTRAPSGPGTKRVVHSKYMLIDGYFAGSADKIVFTGSHNFNNAALRENDETLLRINSNTIHDQFVANFNRIASTLG